MATKTEMRVAIRTARNALRNAERAIADGDWFALGEWASEATNACSILEMDASERDA